MDINEDNISNLSKKIKDNLDEIKITLTFTESVEGYYQTENNKCSEYSDESNEDEMDNQGFSVDDFSYYEGKKRYDEEKHIYEGEVLIIDKCEINPKSFILLLEKFYEDDDFDDKSWYSFNQDYLSSCAEESTLLEAFGVQGYNGSSENIFLIDRQIESELTLDRGSNLVTTVCIKESNEVGWEFKIEEKAGN